MKKIILMSVLATMASSLSAATLELSLEELNTQWGEGTAYDPATKTITFCESWAGCGWWLGSADYSDYDKLVVEFEPSDAMIQATVQYNGDIADSSSSVQPGKAKVECELDPEGKADVMQIFLQPDIPCELVLKAAYLTNNEPPAEIEKTQLPLDDLGSGWDTEYDPETHVITYQGAWTGRGWWFGDIDYSEYFKVVVEFEPVDFSVQLVIEYVDDAVSFSKSIVNPGRSSVECELDPAGADHVKQIYIQSSAEGTLQLKEAYLAKLVDNAVEDIRIEEADGAYPVEYFTIQGVRVDNPTEGLYIRRQGNQTAKVIR